MQTISIIIPTFSRNKLLDILLSSITKNKDFFIDSMEVIVVDNNPERDAEPIVKEYKKFQNVVYIHEPISGVSYARNKGAKYACGKYLCFIDDDEEITENFLSELSSLVKRGGQAYIGKTSLKYEDNVKPSWISSKIENYLSKIDYGSEYREIQENEWITAGNLLVSKELFDSIGGFNYKVQRKGFTLTGNEDIILKREIEKRAVPIFYEPKLDILHFVPKERSTIEWLKERAYYQGVSDYEYDLIFEQFTPSKLTKKKIMIAAFSCALIFPFYTLTFKNSLLIARESRKGYLEHASK